MAPEVKAGLAYTSKVDMFSLGVVLAEMYCSFATGHERLLVLQAAREGALPEGLQRQHPMATRLIWALLQADPDQRPTALAVRSMRARALQSVILPVHLVVSGSTDMASNVAVQRNAVA
jgi:serine/threonine protein kinase